MMDRYSSFLAEKSLVAPSCGLTDVPALHGALKPFQSDIVSWALRRGRAAIFAGTGLGKTLQQLVWSDIVACHTGGKVLILTPLAVAQQTVAEAVKFEIEGVTYAKDQASISSRIVVTNYDRIDHFDMAEFSAIVLDESSIIKSHDSKTRSTLVARCVDIPWRLCCTATPAPNDWVELGNHAEFLGVMSEKEMLAMFFVHDGSIRASGGGEWRLKRHAEGDFWRWLSSWAVVIRSPDDLGYDDPAYTLPPLIKRQVTVSIEYRPIAGNLFPIAASTLPERIAARRDSIVERVAAATKIVNAQPDRPWLIWCGLNEESKSLVRAISGAEEVTGSDDRETKADRLLGFVSGRPRVLISKPSIAGFGMNWQHCSDMIFVGLNDSFEQLFQAIRRCWRFGQDRSVNVYLVASELEGAVVANLEEKERKFSAMGDAMAGHMIELTQRAVRGGRVASETYNPTVTMELPQWIAA